MRKLLFTVIPVLTIMIMGFTVGRLTADCKEKICAKSAPGKTRTEVRYKTEYRDRDCPPCKTKEKTVLVPKMNCPKVYRCKEELNTCKQSVEDIQLWCNPYCVEQLEECRSELSGLLNSYQGYYSQMPYHP